MHELVESGVIKNRNQMLDLLRGENIQISREAKNSITVILPGSTKKNRLQGGIYADFKDTRELEERGAETIRRIRQYHNRDIQSEIQQYRNQINELVSKRDEYNIGEFELKTSDPFRHRMNQVLGRGDISDLIFQGYIIPFKFRYKHLVEILGIYKGDRHRIKIHG